MKTNAMDKKLFSLRTHFLYKSAKTFFLLFLVFIGVFAWGQCAIMWSWTNGSCSAAWEL